MQSVKQTIVVVRAKFPIISGILSFSSSPSCGRKTLFVAGGMMVHAKDTGIGNVTLSEINHLLAILEHRKRNKRRMRLLETGSSLTYMSCQVSKGGRCTLSWVWHITFASYQ